MIDCVLAYPVPTKDSPTKGPALSIFYPGAMLEQRGFDLEYFDERFDKFDEFVSLVKKGPLCVGVSSMTGYQLVGSKYLFETVKKINPKIYTIFGGVHPSILPKQCIKEPFIDFVVVGEGEKTLFELIATLKNEKDLHKVDGICWKENERIVVNKPREFMNPSEWPFPMTQKNKKYFKIAADRNELMFQTARGCPWNCSFCYNKLFNRGTWRQMPLDKFENELNIFLKEFKFEHIYINDDNIGSNKERIKRMAEFLRNSGLSWSTGMRCSDIDDESAKILDENGCDELLLGAESGSDRVLKKVLTKGYPNGTDDIRNCARSLSKTKIYGRYNFMSGVPTESIKEIHQSMDLVDWIYKVDKNSIFCFDAYAPYPGSRLYKKALETYFNEPKNLEEWSKMTLSNETVPIAQNLYYITGLRFRGKKGDVTSRNFPGLKRLLILPFEISAHIRWRTRFLSFYDLEKAIIIRLFAWASKRANFESQRS
jgi:radical SAM superfamily enzyme YgiQ (UPF0313 family)